MINIKDLEPLNLSKNEAEIFLGILENPHITATELIQKTGKNRKVIYDAIKRLEKTCLITSKKNNKTREYFYPGVSSLNSIIDEERTNLFEKEQAFSILTKKIEEIIPNTHADAMVFSGKMGIRYAFNLLLSLKSDFFAYGGPLESETMMDSTFWLNFHQKNKESGISYKMLFNESLRKWLKEITNPKVKIRFLNGINPLAETIICKKHVIVIIWTEDPIVTITINKAYADSQIEIFKFLWEKSVA